MNSCNLEVKDGRLVSTALCVSSCPEEQLNTLEEVQLFAKNSGRHHELGVTCADLHETVYPDPAFSGKVEIVFLCGGLFLHGKSRNIVS